MKALLVITRENRAERPSEQVLDAISKGVENAVGAGVTLPTPTSDSFLLLTSITDINSRITKYLASPRYSPLTPKLNEGYFLVTYTTENKIEDSLAAEMFTHFNLQVYKVNGEDLSLTLNSIEEARATIAELHASDGWNLIGEKQGNLSQYVDSRPPLRKENNYYLIPDLNVVNAFETRKADLDRF